jgi:hypothetical protein
MILWDRLQGGAGQPEPGGPDPNLPHLLFSQAVVSEYRAQAQIADVGA